MRGVVVGHDEDDVGAGGGRGRGADGEQDGGQGRHHDMGSRVEGAPAPVSSFAF